MLRHFNFREGFVHSDGGIWQILISMYIVNAQRSFLTRNTNSKIIFI